MPTKTEVEALRRQYVGQKVHVIINDSYTPIDSWGTVTHVDDAGQLHGTWGSLAAIPGIDFIGRND